MRRSARFFHRPWSANSATTEDPLRWPSSLERLRMFQKDRRLVRWWLCDNVVTATSQASNPVTTLRADLRELSSCIAATLLFRSVEVLSGLVGSLRLADAPPPMPEGTPPATAEWDADPPPCSNLELLALLTCRFGAAVLEAAKHADHSAPSSSPAPLLSAGPTVAPTALLEARAAHMFSICTTSYAEEDPSGSQDAVAGEQQMAGEEADGDTAWRDAAVEVFVHRDMSAVFEFMRSPQNLEPSLTASSRTLQALASLPFDGRPRPAALPRCTGPAVCGAGASDGYIPVSCALLPPLPRDSAPAAADHRGGCGSSSSSPPSERPDALVAQVVASAEAALATGMRGPATLLAVFDAATSSVYRKACVAIWDYLGSLARVARVAPPAAPAAPSVPLQVPPPLSLSEAATLPASPSAPSAPLQMPPPLSLSEAATLLSLAEALGLASQPHLLQCICDSVAARVPELLSTESETLIALVDGLVQCAVFDATLCGIVRAALIGQLRYDGAAEIRYLHTSRDHICSAQTRFIALFVDDLGDSSQEMATWLSTAVSRELTNTAPLPRVSRSRHPRHFRAITLLGALSSLGVRGPSVFCTALVRNEFDLLCSRVVDRIDKLCAVGSLPPSVLRPLYFTLAYSLFLNQKAAITPSVFAVAHKYRFHDVAPPTEYLDDIHDAAGNLGLCVPAIPTEPDMVVAWPLIADFLLSDKPTFQPVQSAIPSKNSLFYPPHANPIVAAAEDVTKPFRTLSVGGEKTIAVLVLTYSDMLVSLRDIDCTDAVFSSLGPAAAGSCAAWDAIVDSTVGEADLTREVIDAASTADDRVTTAECSAFCAQFVEEHELSPADLATPPQCAEMDKVFTRPGILSSGPLDDRAIWKGAIASRHQYLVQSRVPTAILWLPEWQAADSCAARQLILKTAIDSALEEYRRQEKQRLLGETELHSAVDAQRHQQPLYSFLRSP